MDERGGSEPSALRRAVLRLLPTPVDTTPDEPLWVRDAPPLLEVIDGLGEPRIADLDALLRDVDDLRGALRRDLSLAATAADAGESDLAAWLVTQDDGLRAFEARALGHLDALAQADDDLLGDEATPAARPRRRMLTPAPFAAAAALVFAFVIGVGTPSTSLDPATPAADNAAALASYDAFSQLALEGGSVSQISAAAQEFHADLAPLVSAPGTDPAVVSQMIRLLQSERAMLIAGGTSTHELTQVLREADRLVARLRANLNQAGLPVPAPEQKPRPEPSPAKERQRSSERPAASSTSPSPKPTASSPKPSASPTAASPKPTASPTSPTSPAPSPTAPSPRPSNEPTPTPTAPGPLPKAP